MANENGNGNYVKARVEEARGKAQPSKQHEQPIVVKDPKSQQPIYREQP